MIAVKACRRRAREGPPHARGPLPVTKDKRDTLRIFRDCQGWAGAIINRVTRGCQCGAWLCLRADFSLDGDALFFGKQFPGFEGLYKNLGFFHADHVSSCPFGLIAEGYG